MPLPWPCRLLLFARLSLKPPSTGLVRHALVALFLELVLHPHRDGEVDIRLGDLVSEVDPIAGDHGVGRDAEDPARRAVQVQVSAEDRRWGKLVVVEVYVLRLVGAQILLEVRIGSAKERVRADRAVLVVGPSHSGPAVKMYSLMNGPLTGTEVVWPTPLVPK